MEIFIVTFHTSKHFCQRLADREITLEECKQTVLRPDYQSVVRGTPMHGGKTKLFQKQTRKRNLIVVAEVRNNDVWLVTTYFE